jgi:hypothetical protein
MRAVALRAAGGQTARARGLEALGLSGTWDTDLLAPAGRNAGPVRWRAAGARGRNST